jgi:hypothetical protein
MEANMKKNICYKICVIIVFCFILIIAGCTGNSSFVPLEEPDYNSHLPLTNWGERVKDVQLTEPYKSEFYQIQEELAKDKGVDIPVIVPSIS